MSKETIKEAKEEIIYLVKSVVMKVSKDFYTNEEYENIIFNLLDIIEWTEIIESELLKEN